MSRVITDQGNSEFLNFMYDEALLEFCFLLFFSLDFFPICIAPSWHLFYLPYIPLYNEQFRNDEK